MDEQLMARQLPYDLDAEQSVLGSILIDSRCITDIIGIALILSLSNGITAWIGAVQEETLSSYPISIQAESVDMSALMTTLMGIRQEDEKNSHELDAVYSSSVMHEMVNSINQAQVQTNNLTMFKEFLEKDEEINDYISHIQYS